MFSPHKCPHCLGNLEYTRTIGFMCQYCYCILKLDGKTVVAERVECLAARGP